MSQSNTRYLCCEEGHIANKCPKRGTLKRGINETSDQPSTKKNKKDQVESFERCKIPLGKSINAVVNQFLGKIYVHIRHYDPVKHFPTTNGVGLTLQRWKELSYMLSSLEDIVEDYENLESQFRRHLGGNYHVSVTPGFPCVDIRKFWLPEGAKEVCATRKGISLGFTEFRNLLRLVPKIEGYLPELVDVLACSADNVHQNQEGWYLCAECNPNGVSLY